ncbi:MAG TPA: acyl-CoA dehydrogenase family protein [Pseudomonadales bacterium]
MTLTDAQAEALHFHLEHIAHLPRLQQLERFAHADADSTRMIIEQAAGFAGETLAPLAASADVSGCTLDASGVKLPPGTAAAYRAWCELGFPSLALPLENDGLGFPLSVQSAVQELCDGANLAFGMLGINLRCAALALLKNAAPELAARWVPGLIDGSIASTIVISEAQAGSDVGRILTAATPQPDGQWSLNGSKLWISYGDHDATDQILHLVLARVPNGEAGTRGLGLFAVPKRTESGASNGVSVLRLEHKMGLHASPTCVLDLKDARGWLVGEAGRGLQALFVMMNGMRLAVAVQGAAVANVATLHAIAYARERPQGGHPLHKAVPISEHADVRRMLLEMTAHSELLRALALRTACFLDLGTALDGIEASKWQALGELLLPIAKTLNAETAFNVASQGIQVLGGYGYTNDYPLERLARDIRVAAIYEGTSGIQALDFLKRKVLADKAATLDTLLELVAQETAATQTPYSAPVAAITSLLRQTVAILRDLGNSADDGAYALLQLSGCLVHAWNGHALHAAAAGTSDYQQRLRAALELHAGSIVDTANLWAAKAVQQLPAWRFA